MSHLPQTLLQARGLAAGPVAGDPMQGDRDLHASHEQPEADALHAVSDVEALPDGRRARTCSCGLVFEVCWQTFQGGGGEWGPVACPYDGAVVEYLAETDRRHAEVTEILRRLVRSSEALRQVMR